MKCVCHHRVQESPWPMFENYFFSLEEFYSYAQKKSEKKDIKEQKQISNKKIVTYI